MPDGSPKTPMQQMERLLSEQYPVLVPQHLPSKRLHGDEALPDVMGRGKFTEDSGSTSAKRVKLSSGGKSHTTSRVLEDGKRRTFTSRIVIDASSMPSPITRGER